MELLHNHLIYCQCPNTKVIVWKWLKIMTELLVCKKIQKDESFFVVTFVPSLSQKQRPHCAAVEKCCIFSGPQQQGIFILPVLEEHSAEMHHWYRREAQRQLRFPSWHCYIKYRDLKNAFPFNLPQNTHILNVRMLVHLIPNYIYQQNSYCVRESMFLSDIDAQEVKHYNVQYRCNIDDENMQSQWVLLPSSYIHSHTCTMHSLLNPLYKTLLPSWLLKSLLCHGHMTNLQTRRGQI